MAGEVLIQSTVGACSSVLSNGTSGQVLKMVGGVPTWASDSGGPSADASNAIIAGSDGKAYISCEEIQDCIGLAIANGLGITYNDAINAISGALSIPITSGVGVPDNTVNSPMIYTNSYGNVYYRDATGTIKLIVSASGGLPTNYSTDWNGTLATATGTKIYLDENGSLRGVPEHTSVTAHDSASATIATTINPGTTTGAISPVVTMNNPSTTRVMNSYWILTGIFNAFYADGTNADSQLYLSYNGGAFTSVASENHAISGASFRHDHRILVDSAYQIARGGTITLQVRNDMTSYAGTLTFSSALASASGIGVTV